MSQTEIYRSGYTLMIFEDLEREVIRFLENIPLEYYQSPRERERIYSPKIINIITNIGSRIDEFFRNWDIVREISKKIYPNMDRLDMRNYKLIERENILVLSDKEVFLPSINDSIIPFETWSNWNDNYVYRNWWRAYNHVKHDGYNSRTEGNLNNMILSLAGLFVLNCFHKDLWILLAKNGYITEPKIATLERPLDNTKDINDYYIYRANAKSKLFISKTNVEITSEEYFGMIFRVQV